MYRVDHACVVGSGARWPVIAGRERSGKPGSWPSVPACGLHQRRGKDAPGWRSRATRPVCRAHAGRWVIAQASRPESSPPPPRPAFLRRKNTGMGNRVGPRSLHAVHAGTRGNDSNPTGTAVRAATNVRQLPPGRSVRITYVSTSTMIRGGTAAFAVAGPRSGSSIGLSNPSADGHQSSQNVSVRGHRMG